MTSLGGGSEFIVDPGFLGEIFLELNVEYVFANRQKLTHPIIHIGNIPSTGPAPTIFAGVKEVIKPPLLTNFQEGPSIFASVMTVLEKFRTPL